MLDQNILGLLIQQIKTDFNLTDAEAGLLLGPTQAIFYALVAVPFSRYIDRWTRKWIIAGGLIVWSLATAASGLAANFTQLFIARVVVGAGESVNGPTAYSMVADCFPRDKLPRAVSTLQIGSVAGSGLSLLLGGLMIWLVATLGSPDLPIVGIKVKEPPRHNLRLKTRNAGFKKTISYLWLHVAVFGPMFLGLTVGSLDAGGRAWGAAFFERTYGWSPTQYGIVSGVVSIIAMLAGLYLGAKWAEWFQNRGDPAGAYRVILYTRLVAIPFAIMQPLMPTPELAMAFSSVAYLSLGMKYLFIYTVVGVGLAPFVTGLTTDFIFTSPDDLRWSIMLLHVVFLPAALAITWLGLKPFRKEVERLNAEDARVA
ncbi:MAG: hypothetical protein B7Y88_15010 [Sphingomonadales bacterium 32-64-17]|nr:MAG: hypothetical protein B7Y88_15010 [Sphingomonadales bacterium 32-64-17]